MLENVPWILPVRALLTVELWGSAVVAPTSLDACLDTIDDSVPNCVVAGPDSPDDVSALVRSVEERDLSTSVVLLLRGTDFAAALSAQDHAALQLMAWPGGAGALRERVDRSLKRSAQVHALRETRSTIQARFQAITQRELDVLHLLRQGHPSKSVASSLSISRRTVDDHRSSLLRKTGSLTTAEVVHGMDLIELLHTRERILTHGEWRPTAAPPLLTEEPLSPPRPVPGSRQAPAGPRTPLLGLAELLSECESNVDSVCLLDRELRLIWTNPAWSRFAPRGRARERIAREWGLGRRYVAAISPPWGDWYETRFARCLKTGRPWQHEYDCPTPARRDRWRMSATCVGDGLLLRHAWISSEAHELHTAPIVENEYRDARGAVLQCMQCRRVQSVQSERWVLMPEWIARVPRSVLWSLCADCERVYEAA